ncbi:MAG: patatin-like phospholipase family protein [Alistipes sp.]|nr:patatin-like phospholipase family protein [Alistipes sp.]
MSTGKNVALALSSGGPRGFAYIGAIEELSRRGYNITSVAGASIGSLVGGIYAAGRMNEFKEWLFTLDAWRLFSLMDISLSRNHFVKGDKIIEALQEIVPQTNIEELAIPYRAVATDLYTGEEILFDKGDLFTAIRASISIPSLFRPVKYGMTTLVDGCVSNPLPLSRVVRRAGDILMAFDVNDVDIDGINRTLLAEHLEQERADAFEKEKLEQVRMMLHTVQAHKEVGLLDRLKYAGSRSVEIVKDVLAFREENPESEKTEYGDTYYNLLDRSFSLMNHRLSEMAIALYKPEVVVKMPFDTYGDIADYAKGQEISEIGRELMRKALDEYEMKQGV